MKICGIICEYNPFHTGHERHISSAKRETGADGIVCVMSGNFVQRGDLAIYDKWFRAQEAVLGGADLVVELPTPYALSSAQYFAESGVHILEALGTDILSFGSECGDMDKLFSTAVQLDAPALRAKIKSLTDLGLSYHEAVSSALSSPILDSPNNLLAIEYIRAANALSFHTVKRTNEHDKSTDCASAIRERLESGELSSNSELHFCKYAEKAILSRLRAMTAAEISQISGCGEGLENRLYNAVRTALSFDELISSTKSKRYPLSRIRRFALCSVLGIKKGFPTYPPYARVLAFNDIGREIILQAKLIGKIPIITKVSEIKDDGREIFETECRATDFYTLSSETPGICGLEYLKSPIYVKKDT